MEGETSALEAVVKGVAVEEANEENTTVGIGASPDQSGRVTLDACVMDAKGNCGAVMAVENIVHVARLAQHVMEDTPHVNLAGVVLRSLPTVKDFQKHHYSPQPLKKDGKYGCKNLNLPLK